MVHYIWPALPTTIHLSPISLLMRTYLHLTFAFFFLAFQAKAQVVINEFSAANMDGLTDNFGEHEDWIELYNTGNQAVSLAGYYLSDDVDNSDKWKIPAGVTIAAGGYLVVYASDRDLVNGADIHAGFSLTQTKNEDIALFTPQEVLVDAIEITQPNQVNHSTGRVSDGAASWGIFTQPTPGAPNGNAFQAYASKPVLSQAPGFYPAAITVSMSAGASETIRYTLDGSEPTSISPVYAAPITIGQTTVVKAKVYPQQADLLPSFTEANTYFINVSHTVPVISIAGTDLADLLNGAYSDPRGSFEYFDNGAFIDEAYGEYNKHGNDSWAYAQRGIDYITRDPMGYSSSIKHEIFPDRDRDSYQRLIIKAAANDNYPAIEGAHIRDAYLHTLSLKANMELDERTYEPCVLYLNGEYWGVYEIREKVDDPDFTRQYFDQGEKWLDFIKTWGGTWEEYGSRADWDDLHAFITNNDMTIPANYDYAKERLNMLSLIDYMILNTHAVCMDWLNWNTAWWRGRKPDGGAKQWRYALWDLDATFGHYVNYTGIPDTSPDADPCYGEDLPADFEGHGQLIQALMANEDFHSLYVNRYADLNNSFFTCEYMNALLDSLIARIEPEMPAQIQKWGGTMAGWQANVQELRDFINSRCTSIDMGIVDCYEVEGPYPVTVKIQPATSPNKVRVNTITPSTYPFAGDYFVGTTLNLKAEPHPDWVFDHWEVANNPFQPGPLADSIQFGISSSAGDVVTAVFVPAIPCADPYNIIPITTLTSIQLNWEGPSNSISYEIGFRKTGSGDDWNTLTTTELDHLMNGLDICTEYDIRMRTICDFALGSYLNYTIKTNCLTGAEEAEDGIAEWSAFPSPFSERLQVNLVLAEKSAVLLQLVNANGQLVREQQLGDLPAGQHGFQWEDLGGLPSGMYIVKVATDRAVFAKRLVGVGQ